MKHPFFTRRARVRPRISRLAAGMIVFALHGLWASENIGLERSRLHAIQHKGPAVDFFSGALLGNGGLGAVVTTRPDAIVVYFGHNNVWDIRIAENHREEIGTFSYVFQQVKAIPDTLKSLTENSWYKNYAQMARDNYRQPYPRPFPCGALLLVSDQPMIPEGVKTEASDAKVSAEFVQNHIKVGIESLKLIRRNGKSVRHLRFDE